MKITKTQLKQIIKEELGRVLNESSTAPDINFLAGLRGRALLSVLQCVDVDDLFIALYDEEHPLDDDIIHNIYGVISKRAGKMLQDRIDGWYSGKVRAPSSDEVIRARQALVDVHRRSGSSREDYEPGMAPR